MTNTTYFVQETSRIRSFVNAYCDYKVGGLDGVTEIEQPSEDTVDSAIRSWLGMNGNLKRATGTGLYGNTTYPSSKKAQKTSRERGIWNQNKVMHGYQLTKKQMMKEIVRCGKDSNYFINSFITISHPIKGTIPFNTFDYQTRLLESYQDYRFNVILKARQIGISEITAAYVVWMMLFHKDKNILVMATKFATAANLVKKVKRMIKSLPEWVQIASISVDNRTSFRTVKRLAN